MCDPAPCATVLLEGEHWAPAAVDVRYQLLADSLMQPAALEEEPAASEHPACPGAPCGLVARTYTLTLRDESTSAPGEAGAKGMHLAAPTPKLQVGGRGFFVVKTQLVLLDMLSSYCEFQQAVPTLAADTAQRALEILKVQAWLRATARSLLRGAQL